MFHKKTLLTILVFGLILGAGIASTFAFGGHIWGSKADWTPEQIEAKKALYQEMNTALENGDYEAWQALMPDKDMSEEDFNKYVEMYLAKQSGDYTAVKAFHSDSEFDYNKGHYNKMGRFGKFTGDHTLYDKNGDGICDKADLGIE